MKKSVCIVLMVCLTALSAAALDLGDLEFEVTSERTEDGRRVYDGIDQYGNQLTLVGTENLNDTSRKALQVMLATFNGWEYLTIGEQRVVIKEGRTEMALIPESFVYRGTNLAEYMPSGMQFYYTTYLEYDFRMYKDRLFLRVSGQLFDEEQFCKKLKDALDNPVRYIQTHNPDYIIEQLGMISSELEKTRDELAEFREDYDALETEYRALEVDYLALKQDYEELETNHERLSGDAALLRNAVMAFSNGGLFKLLDPLSDDTVKAVVAAKTASPDIAAKDLASQLKDQGVDVSSKMVEIIFAVYFNDFEQ